MKPIFFNKKKKMASNKVLIGIIIVLVLIIAVGAGYFIEKSHPSISNNPSKNNEVSNPNSNQESNSNAQVKITSAHLEIFPAGAQIGPDIKGTETSTFSLDSQVGLALEAQTSKQISLTYKIFDESGVDTGLIWHGLDLKINNGPFSFCCIENPKTPGKYVMKLYLDGAEENSLPFEVSP